METHMFLGMEGVRGGLAYSFVGLFDVLTSQIEKAVGLVMETQPVSWQPSTDFRQDLEEELIVDATAFSRMRW
jgi:hypothetical protein